MITLPNLKRIRYTDKTAESILRDMVDQIPSLSNKWTDFSPNDMGIVILELLAHVQELLLFYLDKEANEAFIETARERKNIINLCKLIAYRLSGVTSSSTILEFTLESPHFARVDIPKYTRTVTKTDQTIYFATISQAVIPTGDTTVRVGARQGVPKTENFRSDGTASQRFRMSESLIDADSIQVVIDDIIWEQVTSFVNSQSSDRQFLVEIDPFGNLDVILGDGFYGYHPPASGVDNVSITYLLSDGSSGNVGTGTVNTLLDTVRDAIGNAVSLSVTNVQSATGGDDEETLEHAKRQAPAELSALYRAMTKSDFIALSEGFPGVGKANAWGEQESDPPNYNMFNWINVVVAPEGVTRDALLDDLANGLVSDQLKSDLRAYFKNVACATTRIVIHQVTYVAVDVTVEVFYRSGALSTEVKSNVESEILDFFSFENVSMGREIRLSNLNRIIDSVTGVDYVKITKLKSASQVDNVNNTVPFNLYELPYLNNLVITVAKTEPIPQIPNVYPFPPAPPAPVD